MSSIRKALLLTLIAGIGALLASATVAVYLSLQDEVDELFDAQLQQIAQSYPNLSPTVATRDLSMARSADSPLKDLVVEMRFANRRETIYRSRPGPAFPDSLRQGFSTVTLGGVAWRLYRATSAPQTVIVGQPQSVRRQAADDIAQSLLLPLAVALPLSALLIWLVVGRGLRALLQLSTQLQARSPADLRPVITTHLARELVPIAESLNGLFIRLESAFRMQQHFIADAAHELLTPLTALGLQAELLERAASPSEDAAVRADLRDGVNHVVHLARQLLDLARAAPESLHRAPAVVDLADVAAEVVRLLAPRQRQPTLELKSTPARVTGDFAALHTAVANLVDNAIKYGGDRILVTTGCDTHCVWLEVSDKGPGVAPADLTRLVDRFYRVPGQKVYGSGLGLAIVDEITRRHAARLTLSSPGTLGGFTARISFRRPDCTPDVSRLASLSERSRWRWNAAPPAARRPR